MPVVPYNIDSLGKCRCPACPVHNSSRCISQRTGGTEMEPGVLLDPGGVEAVYCSQAVDRSTCPDLNGNLPCICPTCAVWAEYGLQGLQFCMQGAAE